MNIEEKLSVIIPIYNVEKYLDRCLSSIINQTYTNIEIILIDDGSTDRSKEICEKWRKKDNRIRIYSQINSGVSTARNIGFNLSSGEAIIFIDADDEIEKTMLEDMACRLFQFSYIDMVCCGYTNEFYDKILEYKPKEGILDGEEIMKALFDYRVMTAVWNKMFRREVLIDEMNHFICFPTNIYVGEDFLWLATILKRCRKIYCIEKIYYHWYRRTDSTTGKANIVKVDVKALSEIDSIESVTKICKEVSQDVYYLACTRYFGILMSKLKTRELMDNQKAARDICYRMKLLIQEYPVRCVHDYLKIQKAKIIMNIKYKRYKRE